MILITLKELNDSFHSLKTAAESLTAGKMKYRFARVLKSATDEVELLGKALAELAQKHGAEMLGGNRFQFGNKPREEMSAQEKAAVDEKLKAFNIEADAMMRSEMVELWGDPEFFKFDDLEKAADPKNPINAADLANLLWLISDGESADPEPPKAASAAA